MVQIISPSPAAMQRAEIGKGIGTGIAKRLGLQEAEQSFQAAKGDPVKLATAMARLMSVSPELARGAGPMYQAMLSQIQGQAMGGPGGQKAPDFPFPNTGDLPQGAENPSLPKRADQIKQLEGFIPPEHEEMMNEAGQRYRANPAMFGGDANKAIEFVQNKYKQKEIIQNFHEARHQKLNKLQDSVVERLKKQAAELGAEIPQRAMNDIIDNAIESIGKEGMTEQEVIRKYGNEVDEAARKYRQIQNIGSWGLITNPKESKATIKALQKDFKKRGDLRNFADSLTGKLQISPHYAWALADPLEDHPKINSFVKQMKMAQPGDKLSENTLEKLASMISEEDISPQSVFHGLIKKDYDPLQLKNYLDTNRDKLKMNALQVDQLGIETSPAIPFMNDIWLNVWGDL